MFNNEENQTKSHILSENSRAFSNFRCHDQSYIIGRDCVRNIVRLLDAAYELRENGIAWFKGSQRTG